MCNAMNVQILRRDAYDIFCAGLKAVDPAEAVRRFVSLEKTTLRIGQTHYNLQSIERLYVIGAGKAAASMAKAVEEILADHIAEGLLIVKYGHVLETQKIVLHEAGHPVPDEAGLAGTRRILRMLEPLTQKDLVLCLLSGGGSALLTAPADGITLADKQQVTRQLLQCGATIGQINAIRKHLSAVKGGQLARIAYPAAVSSLIVSDVIGDPLDVIASGPTVADESTFDDCMAVLKKYKLTETIPPAVMNRIYQGVKGLLAETPKPDDPVLSGTQNLIIASNSLALDASAQKAKELGYNTRILSTTVDGPTRLAALAHTALLKKILGSEKPVSIPTCILSGGETTVIVRGNGLGGRNQEFVLAAAMEIEGLDNTVVFSAGTDGTDGPTDAAGAVADGKTTARARAKQMNPNAYLENNDSYHFFESLGDLIKTGPTHTNVMDLHLLLAAD
jgi:hydroxypyruvate reductase